MRFTLALLPLALVAVGCDSADTSARPDAGPAYSQTAGRPLTAALSGANEVNAAGQGGVGDPDGTGSARVTINVGQNRLCFDIDVTNVDAARRGHIHEAPAGKNGPIVVELFEAGAVPGDLAGCVRVERALLREIAKTPSDYYVNVHNAAFPAGAVRGQLSK